MTCVPGACTQTPPFPLHHPSRPLRTTFLTHRHSPSTQKAASTRPLSNARTLNHGNCKYYRSGASLAHGKPRPCVLLPGSWLHGHDRWASSFGLQRQGFKMLLLLILVLAFYVQDPTAHEEEALRTIEAALAHGVNLLDTACTHKHPRTHLTPLHSLPAFPRDLSEPDARWCHAFQRSARRPRPHQVWAREIWCVNAQHRYLCPSLTRGRGSGCHKIHALSHGKWRNAGWHPAATVRVFAATRLRTRRSLLHAP